MSWFNRIVANKSKDYIKKKKPSLFECDEDEAYEVIADENMTFSPEENVDKEDLRITVMQALDELSEDKKACIVMMYYEENSIGEIAKCLEIPEGTVKTRLYHGRNELKRCFERAGVTSLYSAAPIGIIIWALRSSAQTAQASFAASPAYTSVLAGVKAAAVSTAAAATAASTTTAGTAVAAAAASTTVATGATAKVIAIAVAGVVAIGGGATAAKVVHDKRAEETTAAVSEQSTELSSENLAVIATEESTETTIEFENSVISFSDENSTTHITVTLNRADNTTKSDILQSTGPPDTVKTTIHNKTTAQTTTVKSTAKPATTEKQTTVAPSTTKKQTANGELNGSGTTTARVITTKPTTTAQTTAKPTTTAKSTTAQAPTTAQVTTVGTATVNIRIINTDNSVAEALTFSVEAGTVLTESYIWTLAESKGYSIYGVFGDDLGKTAVSGSGYTFEAEI